MSGVKRHAILFEHLLAAWRFRFSSEPTTSTVNSEQTVTYRRINANNKLKSTFPRPLALLSSSLKQRPGLAT